MWFIYMILCDESKEKAVLPDPLSVCLNPQVEEFSPRAVYTSGKASSAAGLTAAVVRVWPECFPSCFS